MLELDKLKNVVVFMERAPLTGKEAFAWTETYVAVMDAIKALTPSTEKLE